MKVITKRFLVALAISLCLGTLAKAQGHPKEQRLHFALMKADKTLVYSGTVVVQLSETSSSRTLLLQDAHGERFILTNVRSYEDKTDTYTFSKFSGEPLLKVVREIPLVANNRNDAMAELKRGRVSDEVLDPMFEATAGSARAIRARESQWKDAQAGAGLRGELRRQLNADFVSRLQSLLSAFSFPELSDFCTALEAIGMPCAKNSSLRFATISPDCTFDSRFGVPCTAIQISRQDRARQGEDITYY